MQLGSKTADLAALDAKFTKLKEDFHYNLRVLDERDSELAQYDAAVQRMAADVAACKRDKADAEAAAASAESDVQIERDRCAAHPHHLGTLNTCTSGVRCTE